MPTRRDSAQAGVLGVTQTKLIVESQLNWIFREQPTEDYGIDAHVEIVDHQSVTGRLLALQIKSGGSWFDEETDNGWWYRPSMDHLQYWLHHSLPVLIVLHDPKTQKCYWQHITLETLSPTKTGGSKVLVPKQQILGVDSKTVLRSAGRSGGGVDNGSDQLGTIGGWYFYGDSHRHFHHRSMGRQYGQQQDLFTGRSTAVATIQDWLTSVECLGVPLVVTGAPGAGKSSALAHAALGLDVVHYGLGVAFHARDANHADFLAAISSHLGCTSNLSNIENALESLCAAGKTYLIVVDALDEAASRKAIDQIATTLVELAGMTSVRAVVATRRRASGNPLIGQTILRSLSISTSKARSLLDLDTPEYFDQKDLVTLTEAHLTRPRMGLGITDAWSFYSENPEVARRLAGVIAGRAGTNFLVAVLAAYELGARSEPVDPATEDFDERSVPSTLGEAFTRYVRSLPDAGRSATIELLLTALAYARGPGISDENWVLFASALGVSATAVDIHALRSSVISDFLVEAVAPDGEIVTRLFHQAFVDQLLENRSNHADEKRLFRALLPHDPRGWALTDGYRRTYCSDHAAAAGLVEELLQDPQFLASTDLSRLLSALPRSMSSAGQSLAATVRQAVYLLPGLPPERRLRLLALSAAHLGLPEISARFNSFTPGLEVGWAHTLGLHRQQIPAHTGRVTALIAANLNQRDVVVSGGEDGYLRVWNPNGTHTNARFGKHTDGVRSIAIARHPAYGDVLVTSSIAGHGFVWTSNGDKIAETPPDPAQGAPFTIGRLGGDQDVLLGMNNAGVIHCWTLDGQPIDTLFTTQAHKQLKPISSMTTVTINDREVVVTAGHDHSLQVFDAAGTEIESSPGEPFWVGSTRFTRFRGKDVLIGAGMDSRVWLWELNGTVAAGPFLAGHRPLGTATVGQFGPLTDVIVVGNCDGTVWLLDSEGRPVVDRFAAHNGWVTAVTSGKIDGRHLIATGGQDGTIRLWDLDSYSQGHPLRGHTDRVNSVTATRINGQHVTITGAEDGTIRTWQSDGTPHKPPITGYNRRVTTVAVAHSSSQQVIVSGGGDAGDIRRWKFDGTPVGDILGGAGWVSTVFIIDPRADPNIIGSTHGDGNVRLWTVEGNHIATLATNQDPMGAVAAGRLDGVSVVVSVTTQGASLEARDLSGALLWSTPTGHNGYAMVTTGQLDGLEEAIITGGTDGQIKVWKPGNNLAEITIADLSTPITAIAAGRLNGQDVIAAARQDNTIQIWSKVGQQLTIDLFNKAVSIAIIDGELHVAGSQMLATWRPQAVESQSLEK